MRKILLILACLFLSFTISSALYRHQVGKYDWDYRTIGDIDRVHFLKFQVAFNTKDGFIGLFSSGDGKIIWSKDLSASNPLVEYGQSGFLVLDTVSRTLLAIDYANGIKTNAVLISDIPPQETIIDFFYEASETSRNEYMGILTTEKLYFFSDNALVLKESHSNSLQHVRYNQEKSSVLGISNHKTKGACIQTYSTAGQSKGAEQCFGGAGKNADIKAYRNNLIIRDSSKVTVVSLSTGANATTSAAKSVYLDQCGVLVTEKGDKCKVHSFKKGGLEEITSVEASFDNTHFACDKEKYLVVTEKAGDSTLKVKRINLDDPKESSKVLLDKVADFSVGNIEEVYVDNLGFDYRLIIKTANLQIILVKDQKIAWKHEDSLSEIKQIQFFDYESLGEQEVNPYFENLDEHHDRLIDLPTNLILRFKAQTSKLVKWINHALQAVTTMKFNRLWESDSKFDKHNGLQKIIIAITKRNTVFGIDSKTGIIFWEKIIDSQWTVEGIYKSKRNLSVKEALLYLKDEKSKKAKIIHLDPLEGRLSSDEEFDKIPQELIQIPLSKSTAYLLIFEDDTVQVFPRSVDREELKHHLTDLSIYRVGKDAVTGYQLFEKSLVQTWNFNLPPKEEVFKTSHWSYDVDETEFKTIVPEDRKVIYKFSDSNNFALLTKSTLERPHVNLYIINGASGRVLNSRSQFDVDFSQPVNLLYDENSIFVSYFNIKSLQTEIWVTELYKNELESSFTDLLQRYFFGELQVDEEAKYNNANPGFVVFTQKYQFIPGVKNFGAIQTIHGVTKKNLIIITANDQIYSMDRGLLNTRRQMPIDGKVPESDPTSFGSSELPPYAPLLPVNNQKFLSYFKKFSGLKHVEATPTRFESTSLSLIYGHDVVYVRVAPEKEFDMLSEDFKYDYLLGTIGLIVIGLIVVTRLSKRQKLLKIFNA